MCHMSVFAAGHCEETAIDWHGSKHRWLTQVQVLRYIFWSWSTRTAGQLRDWKYTYVHPYFPSSCRQKHVYSGYGRKMKDIGSKNFVFFYSSQRETDSWKEIICFVFRDARPTNDRVLPLGFRSWFTVSYSFRWIKAKYASSLCWGVWSYRSVLSVARWVRRSVCGLSK